MASSPITINLRCVDRRGLPHRRLGPGSRQSLFEVAANAQAAAALALRRYEHLEATKRRRELGP